MELHLQNKDLKALINVLETITVRNMPANRGRAKLLMHATKKFNEYGQDELDIIKEFAETDADGELLVNASGQFALKTDADMTLVNTLVTELSTEKVVLSAGEYKKRYEDFLTYLSSCEDNFDAEAVMVIDTILDQFEGASK
ncbi:phage protein [Streptococcus varani]|uniref:Phage protein n=1 Tax=Streptococcus varani TaxID=1608583 RepID=A0A0E4H3L8_9STRE|nr:DUF1617 family protein [Streptococcus varani]CQR24571.1 phage protein [Streptococcus varani]